MFHFGKMTAETSAREVRDDGDSRREETRARPEPAGRNLLEKAYVILDALSADGEWISLSELARNTGLPKSTVHRLLGMLTALGLADRHDDGYGFGPRMVELVKHVSGGQMQTLRDCLLPHLLDLFQVTGNAVHLYVEHKNGTLCVEHLHGHSGTQLQIRTGSVLPKYTSAMGKVLAAHSGSAHGDEIGAELHAEFERIRRDGVAVDLGGLGRGVICVATPIWGPARTAAAVIAVTGHAHAFDVPTVSRQLRGVAHTAARELARSTRGYSEH